MSTTTPTIWPEQLRLPGQAAAPAGPVDLYMMYVMHHAFRRDLAAFAGAVPATPVEDVEAWRALLRRFDIFSGALHHHHDGEDTSLWPVLMERVDESGRATLAAMEAEHGEIDPLLESIGTGLRALAAGGDADTRAALAVRLTAAQERLGRHLNHEERDAMRLLQQHLSDEEWKQIEAAFAPDVSFREVCDLVPWVAHEVPATVLRQVFARTGTVHRVLWMLTRRRFARLDRRAFRYAG